MLTPEHRIAEGGGGYSPISHLTQALLEAVPPCHCLGLHVFGMSCSLYGSEIGWLGPGDKHPVLSRYCLNLFTPCFVTELLNSLPTAALGGVFRRAVMKTWFHQ